MDSKEMHPPNNDMKINMKSIFDLFVLVYSTALSIESSSRLFRSKQRSPLEWLVNPKLRSRRQLVLCPVNGSMSKPVCVRPRDVVGAHVLPPQRTEGIALDPQNEAGRKLEPETPAQAALDNLPRPGLPLALGLARAGQRQRHEVERQLPVPGRVLVDELGADHELDGVHVAADVRAPVPAVLGVLQAHGHLEALALRDVVGEHDADLERAIRPPILGEGAAVGHVRHAREQRAGVHALGARPAAVLVPQRQEELVGAQEQRVVPSRAEEVVGQGHVLGVAAAVREDLVGAVRAAEGLTPQAVEVADLQHADVGVHASVAQQQRPPDQVRGVLDGVVPDQGAVAEGAREHVRVLHVYPVLNVERRAGLPVHDTNHPSQLGEAAEPGADVALRIRVHVGESAVPEEPHVLLVDHGMGM